MVQLENELQLGIRRLMTSRLSQVCLIHIHLPRNCLKYRLVYIKELDGKKVVQISSGQQHSLALDDTGYDSFPEHFYLLLTLSKSCICLGLQRILPPWFGQSG